MAKNLSEIPYTEIRERVRDLSRSGGNTDSKIRGVVTDIYSREIPAKFDWNFLVVGSSLETIAQHKVGNVTLNTGDTTVVFSSDAALDASFVGRKIKFSSSDPVYDLTGFGSSTDMTITPALRGASNITNGSYTVFQPEYPLATDFDRFPKEGGIWKWTGGRKTLMEEEHRRPYAEDYTSSPSIPETVRLTGMNTAGAQLVEFSPPPADARIYGYEYVKRLAPMRETTAGTISSIAAGAVAVVGNTNTRFTEARTGDYLRIDALGVAQDSTWYRIIAIANDSSLTLQTAFANTAITSSANYTISSVPEMPPRLHIGIVYGGVRSMELDQNSDNFAFYHTQYAQVLSDAKRIYVQRPYSQEITGVHEEYHYRR